MAFYAWRLALTKQCQVTLVLALDPQQPVTWQSPLTSSPDGPDFELCTDLRHVRQLKYNVVIISAGTLQSFHDVCANLERFLDSDSLIVVELTGYVLLEPFVSLCFPKLRRITVCSIMNESEVIRIPNSNAFVHKVCANDQRIYLGTCTDEEQSLYKVADCEAYTQFYKLLQTAQENLGGHISLLKSNNYREFMTYQWKLALPRIVLNPLSIIFEEPFPEFLQKQILAKPLISGLITEVFKIIKKMECKLIKGYENEANILSNWLAHFPACDDSKSSPEYLHANTTFYKFYHQFDIETDLLLLQPILLGDDHGVRTPYLENLYSMTCQLVRCNNGDLSFFSRKYGGLESRMNDINDLSRQLTNLKLERDSMEASHREKLALLKRLELQQQEEAERKLALLEEQSQRYEEQARKFEERARQYEDQARQYEDETRHYEARLQDLAAACADREKVLESLKQPNGTGPPEPNAAEEPRHIDSAPMPPPEVKSRTPELKEQTRTFEILQMQTPDLSDFADVAVYGAALNGDIVDPTSIALNLHRLHSALSEQSDLSEKERELQRREQALADRERSLQAQSRAMGGEYYEPDAQGAQYQYGQRKQPYGPNGSNSFNGQYDYPADQRFNHGYAQGGYPPNSMPPNLRPQQRYQQNGYNMPPRQNRASSDNIIMTYQGQNMRNQMPNQVNNGMPNQMQTRGSSSMQMNGLMSMNGVMSLNGQMPANGPMNQGPMGQGPMNQGPMNQAPMNQGPMPQGQMMHGQMMQGQNMQGQAPMSQGPNGMNQGQMGQGQMGHVQMAPGQMNQGQIPMHQGQAPGYKSKNRRSAFPDALSLDYGGRGGMPMPGANTQKHRPGSAPLPHQSRKSYNGMPTATSSQVHLRPQGNTNESSHSETSHGSYNDEPANPETPDSTHEIRMEVPQMENPGKPLGSVAVVQEKKKKGLFKKHRGVR